MRSQQTSLLQPFSVHGCSSFEILLLGLLFSELFDVSLQMKKLYFPGKIELELFDQASSNKLYLLYPDYTVGIGISPIQLFFLQNRSWTITTGREFHPAPEDEPYIIFVYIFIIHIYSKNATSNTYKK